MRTYNLFAASLLAAVYVNHVAHDTWADSMYCPPGGYPFTADDEPPWSPEMPTMARPVASVSGAVRLHAGYLGL